MPKISDIQHAREVIELLRSCTGTDIDAESFSVIVTELGFLLDDIQSCHNMLDSRLFNADQNIGLQDRIFALESEMSRLHGPKWNTELPDSYTDVLAYFGGDKFAVAHYDDNDEDDWGPGWKIGLNFGEAQWTTDEPLAWTDLPASPEIEPIPEPPSDSPGPIDPGIDETNRDPDVDDPDPTEPDPEETTSDSDLVKLVAADYLDTGRKNFVVEYYQLGNWFFEADFDTAKEAEFFAGLLAEKYPHNTIRILHREEPYRFLNAQEEVAQPNNVAAALEDEQPAQAEADQEPNPANLTAYKAQHYAKYEGFSRWEDIGTFTNQDAAIRNARNFKERHNSAGVFTRVIQVPQLNIIWP